MNDKDKAAAAAAADELLVGEPLKGVVGIDVHEKALADLKADYEAKLTQLAKSHEDADAELRAYKAHEFAGLKNEAVTLGLAVSEKDTIEGLKVRLSDAKAVIAKVPKAPEQTTATRHTKPNMDGETRRSELDNLMAHSGRSSA
jgi:hypothetical protein